MRQIAIYNSAEHAAKIHGVIRWSFRAICLSGLALIVASCLFVFLFQWNKEWVQASDYVFVISMITLVFLISILAYFRSIVCGFERVVAGNAPEMLVRPLLFLALLLIGMNAGLQAPSSALALNAFATLLAAAYSWHLSSKEIGRIAPMESVGFEYETKAWLLSLIPLSLQAGSALINSRLDIAMLGFISGPAAVAVYDIGAKLGGLMMITQAILNMSIAPRLASLYANQSTKEIQSLLVQACRWSFVASFILFIGILVAGSSVLEFLFGSGFDGAYLVALILALGFLFDTAVGAVGLLLDMSGNENITAKAFTASVFLNAGLNLLLIPLFGPFGAAATTTTSRLILQGYLWWRAAKLLNIRGDLLATGILKD